MVEVPTVQALVVAATERGRLCNGAASRRLSLRYRVFCDAWQHEARRQWNDVEVTYNTRSDSCATFRPPTPDVRARKFRAV